ncbi:lysophospholipid acyltransferase family protein [Acinetobacter sp. ANC 3791]|uniref:lysophospholipid acyltransferase family protein n=1 Tax=Acinetobacter sp. ANC 3791 TaxID=2529836 RepID=UPI00103D414B|nr:lysophospholipid acyltransferase family protein [Acinetobacter sp. ANC 3791]TCB84415.1 lipid A biosynthesis acyltransferase [Acinetobacter sp. ANC 3791]
MAIYLLLKFIAIFPLPFLQKIATLAAYILFHTNSSIKRITTINLELAYPELEQTVLQERIRLSIQSQCLTYIEFVKCWGMPPQYSLDLLKNVHGADLLEKALANKKGVIVVIPHFGCWELLNAWLNIYTQPMIMYKPSKTKGMNRYILDARQKFNATLVPTDKTGIRQIFKHLKQGGLTVVLPDHLPKPSGGIYSLFFQQNTLSATLVSKMAAQTQCNVIGLSCIRNSELSSFDVHCTELPQTILSKDLQQSVDSLNLTMQEMVNTAPEQYIWSYKRFRNCYGNINIYRKQSIT